MDTRTGELFSPDKMRLYDEFKEGLPEAAMRDEFRNQLAELERIRAADESGTLARVSNEVAQKVRLGERELERRRRRRPRARRS